MTRATSRLTAWLRTGDGVAPRATRLVRRQVARANALRRSGDIPSYMAEVVRQANDGEVGAARSHQPAGSPDGEPQRGGT